MASSFTVESVNPAETIPALHLILRHVPDDEREPRVRTILHLIDEGGFDPAGLFVVRGPNGLLGAMVAMSVPGAAGLVWPPQAVDCRAQREIEDCLIAHAGAWLRQRGAKLAQALLLPEDASLAAPLQRHGYAHVTQLWYLRHGLDLPLDLLRSEERLEYQPYEENHCHLFHETLLRTYEQTADCPELNGVRDVREIIEGHRAQGAYDPAQWWLALEHGWPVGVLITTVVPETGGWDVSYVGVAPPFRRRGLGRELMHKALLEARAVEATQLTLSVDGRNVPAWNLYQDLGFEPFDKREVFLAVWRSGGGK